jgi:hypothetical protein
LRRIRTIVLLVFVTLTAVSSTAAGGPREEQYGNPFLNEEPPTSTPGDVSSPGGTLPFTGFAAGLLLLAGIAAVGTGAALRRLPHEEQPDDSASAAVAPYRVAPESPFAPMPPPLPAAVAEVTPHLVHCDVCGREFDAYKYQLVILGRSGIFDSVECATRDSSGRGTFAVQPAPA